MKREKLNLADLDDVFDLQIAAYASAITNEKRRLVARIKPTEELDLNLEFVVTVDGGEARTWDIRQAIGLYNGEFAGVWRSTK